MSSTTGEADKLPSLTPAQPCHHFSLAEIQSATNDFDDQLVIGEGGFGKVYKGCICIEETSHVVAIKRLDSTSDQGASEFRAEIEMLSKLRHCHLVSLFGFCDDNREMILVYAYMPHGTLYHHLYKASTYLNWVQRLKIAIGAARGLDYLHTGVGTQHGVIHRDIKSSNILLDENWSAMISDFGLSKVGPTNQSISYVDTSVKGTFGYLDPEYFYTRRLTRKTDVFAFGVVLFELLSGRRPVDISFGEEQCSLVRWAQKCVKDRKLDQMVDSNIRGTISPKCLTRFAQIAYRCVHSVPKERPSMTEVVASLQLLIELQEKHDNSAESSGKIRFAWKIHKYLVPTTKQNSDQSGTSSQKSLSIKKDGSDDGETPLQLGELVTVARDLKKFTYFELKCATRNFETCLVYGGTVEVFKGWVDKKTYSPSDDINGLPITIKILHRYKHLDLDILKELNHPNLVKLIGCCLRFQEIFLVYEFMPLGSFEDCLYTGTIAGVSLVTKVKIAVGIARGMVFLQKKKTLVKSSGKTHLGRTVGDSWIDRHETFLDEPRSVDGRHLQFRILKRGQDLSDDDDDDDPINPWLCKESSRPQSYDIWQEIMAEYELDRCKISLDEDFTAKLSNYKITNRNYLCEEATLDDCYYCPGQRPPPLQNDFSGFAVVLAELLIGRKLYAGRDFEKIEDLLRRHGNTSLRSIAKLCFKICNEVDSESRMLTIFKYYIPTIRSLFP